MKGVCTGLFLVLCASALFGQASGDYRSVGPTGNWNTPASWEVFSSGSWITASASPTNANGVITIRNGHTITVTASLTTVANSVDQVVVENGGTLTVNPGITLTLSNNAVFTGDDININAGGILNVNGNINLNSSSSNRLRVHGRMNNSGAIASASVSKLIFEANSTYYHLFDGTGPNTIPTASWNVSSTVNITEIGSEGFFAPTASGQQSFGNFIWNCPNQDQILDLAGLTATVNGNFQVVSTGTGGIYCDQGGSVGTLSVGGNFVVNGGFVGIFGFVPDGLLTVSGDLTLTAGTLQIVEADETITGTLDVTGNVSVSGTGNLEFSTQGAAANLNVAGDFSFAAGSIAVTNGTGNLNFTGSAPQAFSTALAPTGVVNYSISATSTVNVSGSDLFVNGNLTNDGTLSVGASTTTTFGGTTTLAGSGTTSFNDIVISGVLTAPTGNFNVGGDWTNNGTFTRGGDSNTVTFNGTSAVLGSAVTDFSSVVVTGTLNGPAALNVAGDFTNNGTFVPGTGALVMNGSAAQAIGGVATSFYDITIAKSGGTATVSSSQSITNALTLTGGILNANGNLTLRSTASGDARIAEITGGASISGNVTVERYLPNASGSNTYRYLGSPVTNASVSQWKDDFPITGTFSDPSIQADWPGLNVTSTARNMFLYNEAHTPTTTMSDRYENYPSTGMTSTSTPLDNGRGYSARVRQTTPITVDVTGTVAQGDVPVSVTAQSGGGEDGWNLIANPYAAPIHWNNVNRPASVSTQIALQDNTESIAGTAAGQYVYFTQGGVGLPAAFTGTIASGQAFWVRTTASTAITFQENDKVAVSDPDFIRAGSPDDLLRIHVDGNGRRDEAVILFADDATDNADHNHDAFKLTNDFINLSSLSADGLKLAINTMDALTCAGGSGKEISLAVENVTPGTYTFSFTQLESFGDLVNITLKDNFTGATFNVAGADPVYQFNVTADNNSFGKNRFKLNFSYSAVATALDLKSEDVCVGSNAKVTIENSQKGVQYYPVVGGIAVSDQVISNGGKVELMIPHNKLVEGENEVVVMASIAGCTPVALNGPVTVRADKYSTVITALDLKSEDVCVGSNAMVTIENSEKDVQYYPSIGGVSVSDQVTSTGGQVEFIIPGSKLVEGENEVVVMASIAGCAPVALSKPATIKVDRLYNISKTQGDKHCGEGQLSLVVEGAPANGSYKWYESADAETPISGQTGGAFTTPVLNKTKTYYASAVNALGCEGAREAVTAEVVLYDDVTITMLEHQLTSSYATGNQWFFNGEPIAGAVAQTLAVTETGLYEVEVSINGCSTRASQEMIVMGTEEHAGNGYNFYPNPVQDHLYIELADLGPVSGTVQTSLGQPVGTLKFVHENAKMKATYNFEHQPSGVYLIRVFQNNKVVHFKIIRK